MFYIVYFLWVRLLHKRKQKSILPISLILQNYTTLYIIYILHRHFYVCIKQGAASGNKEYKCHYMMTSNMTLTAWHKCNCHAAWNPTGWGHRGLHTQECHSFNLPSSHPPPLPPPPPLPLTPSPILPPHPHPSPSPPHPLTPSPPHPSSPPPPPQPSHFRTKEPQLSLS